MINKFKYIFVFLIFILISFLIINFPKTYFYFHDQKMLNNVSTNKLNLENIYDNYNLTNNEKLEILSSIDLTNFLMVDEPTREKYEQNITTIKDEMAKINPYLANFFEEYFLFDYNNLTAFSIEKYYLSSSDYRGLTLKNIYYSNDIFDIELIMDAYDSTIFSLSINNIGIQKYSLKPNDSLTNIGDDFRKYLNIDKNFNYIINYEFYDSCYYGCNILSFSIDYDNLREVKDEEKIHNKNLQIIYKF